MRGIDIPAMYSAPASYNIVPVERIFGSIKAKDFGRVAAPTVSEVEELAITKLTNKQDLMAKVAWYLN